MINESSDNIVSDNESVCVRVYKYMYVCNLREFIIIHYSFKHSLFHHGVIT